MNDEIIRQVSVTLALLLVAVLKAIDAQTALLAILTPLPLDKYPFVKVVLAGLSALSIGFVIFGFEWAFYKTFARKFLGVWAYKSSSGNYAIAEIKLHGFWAGGTRIKYSVSLYKTAEEVLKALQHEAINPPFGTAEGIVTAFKDDKFIIIYEVYLGASDYDARRGILTLWPTQEESIVKGIWESTKINDSNLPDRDVRIGDLALYRKKRFIKAYANSK